MDNLKIFLKFWLPVFIWASVIFTLSSFTTPKSSDFYWHDFLVKKSAHLIEYAVLFVLLYRAFKNTTKFESFHLALFSLFLVFLYGASDEFHQSFTPGRGPALRDVIIDTLGGTIAWFSLWKLLPKAPLKLKAWAKNLQLI